MADRSPLMLPTVTIDRPGIADRALVVFASPEPRCLGAAQRFRDYQAEVVCLLRIEDEENAERAENIRQLQRLCAPCGQVVECPMRHGDPVYGIETVLHTIASHGQAGGTVSVDISTFPRNALLLTLRALMDLVSPDSIRLVYTEPAGYDLAAREPLSYGLQRIATIPTFSARYKAEEELVLIVFLGFERDRVLGLWQCVAPHRTVVVIGEPPYKPEWQGVSEHINAAILAGLPDTNIARVDPRDPGVTYRLLKTMLVDNRLASCVNYYIAPFGTKPQTVGVGCFCQRYPDVATIVYAAPVASNQNYITQGIGPTWRLSLPAMD